MKFSVAVRRRLYGLNLSGALLVALLQRTPVLRVAAVGGEFVLASPAGAVLRSAAAAIASLGALHSLAGATQIVASTNSVNTTVGTPIAPIVFVTNGAPTPAFSYIIIGVPPGLTVPGLNSAGILNITNAQGSGVITGTPTLAGSYQMSIQAWEFSNASGSFSVPINILFTISPASASGPPIITSQPASQTSAVGENATFVVGVTANPAATYQWKKNSVNIPAAIGPSLTISGVLLSDAANYFVEVTNTFGTVTSAAATLIVNAFSSGPAFLTQPVSQTIASGSTVVFTSVSNGVPTPVYQWRRNGTAVAGATSPTLVLTGANAIAGAYSVVATNSFGSVTSNDANLTISTTANFGRLSNLSVLTDISSAVPSFTVGTVVGGSGNKPLVVRAAGPALGALGVPGTLSDPKLELFAGQTVVASNDNWGGDPALATAMANVGAFPYAATNSRDAAISASPPARDYTVAVSGVGGATGTVIAEIYDATPSGSFTAATPRLINVSVLKQINAGGSLTLGFTIGGATAKTVLIRAIGPALGLAPFNIQGAMADPQLTLFNSSSVSIATNNDWGGDTQLTAAGTSVGAFAISNGTSRDAMLLRTLPPGGYTATASGVGNAGGLAIVEVYEVP